MPSFTFDIFVYLYRNGEETILARHTHSLYYTVYMALVEQMTRQYTKEGWNIRKVSLQNFRFLTEASDAYLE
jgi:hypothetical protein